MRVSSGSGGGGGGGGGLRIVINRPVVLVSLPCVSLGTTFLPLDYSLLLQVKCMCINPGMFE